MAWDLTQEPWKTQCPQPSRQVVYAAGVTFVENVLPIPIPDYPDAIIARLNEEHGIVDLERCVRKPEIGERVRIIPNHVCVVTNLHDQIYLHRNGDVLAQLPVYLRGKTI